MRRAALFSILLGCGHGGGQAEALLARGQATAAVATYRAEARDGEDPATLRAMATTTLALGLRAAVADVRLAAIRAIERREIEALALEVTRLIGDDDERVSAAAAAAVLRAHPDAPLVCTARLESDDAAARSICVEAIGRKIGAPARDDLLPLLTDRAAAVRRAAATAIGRMRLGEDTFSLAQMATGDGDAGVRAAAMRALRGRREREAQVAAELALSYAWPPLSTYRPPDAALAVRLAAIDVFEGQARVSDLVRIAEHGDLAIGLAAAAAVGRLGGAVPATLASRALGDPRAAIRAGALNRAEALWPAAALPAVGGRLIADPAIDVRLAAARLLARVGLAERAAAEYRTALAHRDPAIRLDAASELARAGDRAGLDALAALAADRDPATRGAAIAAHASARRVTSGLIGALADADPRIRIDAAELLLELLD